MKNLKKALKLAMEKHESALRNLTKDNQLLEDAIFNSLKELEFDPEYSRPMKIMLSYGYGATVDWIKED